MPRVREPSLSGDWKWNLGSGNGESAWLSGVYLVAELGSDTKGGALKRGGYRAMACGGWGVAGEASCLGPCPAASQGPPAGGGCGPQRCLSF